MRRASADFPNDRDGSNLGIQVSDISSDTVIPELCALVATTVLPRHYVLSKEAGSVEFFAANYRLLGYYTSDNATVQTLMPVEADNEKDANRHQIAFRKAFDHLMNTQGKLRVLSRRIEPEIQAELQGDGVTLIPEILSQDIPLETPAKESRKNADTEKPAGVVVPLRTEALQSKGALTSEIFISEVKRYFSHIVVRDRNGEVILEQGVTNLNDCFDVHSQLLDDVKHWDTAVSGMLSRTPKLIVGISDDGSSAFVCAAFADAVVIGETEKSRVGRIIGTWTAIEARGRQ